MVRIDECGRAAYGGRKAMGHIYQRMKLSAERTATLLVGEVAEPILGVETLEGLGLTVDPRRRRLAPSRHYAVRLGAFG